MSQIIILLTTAIFSLFSLFYFLVWFSVLGIIIASLIFWIMMIIDVAKRDFKNDNDKTTWLLIVILAGVIGSIIYYVQIKHKNKS